MFEERIDRLIAERDELLLWQSLAYSGNSSCIEMICAQRQARINWIDTVLEKYRRRTDAREKAD